MLDLIDRTTELFSGLQQKESAAREPYGQDWGQLVAGICTNTPASQALLPA